MLSEARLISNAFESAEECLDFARLWLSTSRYRVCYYASGTKNNLMENSGQYVRVDRKSFATYQADLGKIRISRKLNPFKLNKLT